MWGSSTNNGRGNTIENFIPTNNLCLLNNGSHTYLHPGSGTFSTISLSLCVCAPVVYMELNFTVESDTYGSDHFPIII